MEKRYITQCVHSQQNVTFQNAVCIMDYPCYEPDLPWILYLSPGFHRRVLALQVLFFPITKVGYCPSCGEIKAQRPYCKHIMPIEELSDNDFQCPHCGKKNHVHYIISQQKAYLGNNVAVWNATKDSTVQRTFYYATGVPMSCSTGRDGILNDRLYNGKEYVEDHGYDVYDYGFRGYYATIGRFTSIDPLTEQTPWQSPYVYADNNFVNKVDLWGLAAGASGSGGVYTTSDPNKIAALLEYLSGNNSLDGFDLSGWDGVEDAAKWWIDERNGTFSFTYVINGGGGNGTLMDEWDIVNVTYSLSDVHTSSILGNMAYERGNGSDLLSKLNLFYGGLSNGIGIAGNLTCNDLYWFGKNGKFYTRDLRHKQGGWAYSYKVVSQQKVLRYSKGIGKVLTIVNIGIEIYNILDSSSIKTSNIVNLSLAAISVSGVGALVAAGYFIIDTGVCIATGNSLNDHIDNLTGPIRQW